MRLSLYPVDHRVLYGAFSRLEPCAVKVARMVLRGRGDGNVTSLPDGSVPHYSVLLVVPVLFHALESGRRRLRAAQP